MKKNELFLSLEKSYKNVGELTWQNNDFDDSYLQTSRSFFTTDSLKSGDPNPKIVAATKRILRPPTSRPNLSASQKHTPRIFLLFIRLYLN